MVLKILAFVFRGLRALVEHLVDDAEPAFGADDPSYRLRSPMFDVDGRPTLDPNAAVFGGWL